MSHLARSSAGRFWPARVLVLALFVLLAAVPGSSDARPRQTDADIDAANAAAEKLRRSGDLAGAIKGFQRTVELTRKVYGADHWMVAAYDRNLAMAYIDDEQYDKAEPILRDATARIVQAWKDGDAGDTILAGTFEINAQYNYELGRFQKAADFREDALKLYIRRAPDYDQVAQVHINLAQTYSRMGRHADALVQVEKGLAHRVARHKPNSAALWKARQTKAYVLQMAGRFADAEAIFRDYLEDDLKVLAKGSTPVSMSNLALVLIPLGRFDEADDLLTRFAAGKAKQSGPDSHAAAEPQMALATVKAYAGDKKAAVKLVNQSLPVLRDHFLRVAGGIAEGEQFTYLKDFTGTTLSDALSIAWLNRDDPAAVEKSAEWVLNVKNLLFEVMAERQLLARDGRFPEVGTIAESLRVARRDLANHLGTRPKDDTDEGWYQRRKELFDREEQLSRELARVGGHARSSPKWVSLAEVRKAIPAGEVLIEIKKVELRDFTDKGGPNGLTKIEPRYLAWVIPAAGAGEVKLIDLGFGRAVETGVGKLIENILEYGGEAVENRMRKVDYDVRDGKLSREEGEDLKSKMLKAHFAFKPMRLPAFRKDSRELAKTVLDPLIAAAGGSKRWVVSPDADLWLVPWAAFVLPGDEGRYMVDDYVVRQVLSGRDLTVAAPAGNAGAPLLLINPNYSLGTTPATRRSGVQHPLPALDRFTTAPGGRNVAANMEKWAKVKPEVIRGDKATEEFFKQQIRGPRLALIGTHGSFTPINPDEVRPGWSYANENPFLRCVLVLAGCDKKPTVGDTAEDGRLNGIEVLGCDFRGTELVSLCACQTAQGDVHAGQAAAGMRSAFLLSGARQVEATLWSVDVEGTIYFTEELFQRLANGRPTADALAESQRAVKVKWLKDTGEAHPYYWAGFSLTVRGR